MLYNLQRKKRLSTLNLSVLGLIYTHEILLLFIYFLKCQKFCKHILTQCLACEIIITEVENMAKRNKKVRIAKK